MTDTVQPIIGQKTVVMGELAALVAPMSLREFNEACWQKKPFFRGAAKSTALYDALFKVEQIDDVLRAAAPNATDFDYFAAGSAVSQAEFAGPGNYLQCNRLLGHYAAGGTIHISNLQKYVSALDGFCKALQAHFFADVEADLWATRKNTFPPYLHFDRHDIFILQIYGTKRWRVYAPIALGEGRSSSVLTDDEVGEPLFDVEVQPGDLIYLPAFTPHVVTTTVPHCIHVGLGVHPMSWKQVLECSLEVLKTQPSALQEAAPIELLRHKHQDLSLLRDKLQSAIEQSLASLDFGSVKRVIHDRFIANVTAPDDKHFSRQILQGEVLCATTKLSRRSSIVGRAFISTDNQAYVSYAGGGAITGPPEILPDVQFVLENESSFTANDLPGSLDMPSRLILLQRLVDAGLCMVVLETASTNFLAVAS